MGLQSFPRATGSPAKSYTPFLYGLSTTDGAGQVRPSMSLAPRVEGIRDGVCRNKQWGAGETNSHSNVMYFARQILDTLPQSDCRGLEGATLNQELQRPLLPNDS